MKTALLALLALTLSATAFAGDLSTYRPLGFSANGKYFAFAQTGVGDGSGAAFAEVAVVDVAKNAFVAKKSATENMDGDEAKGDEAAVLRQAIRAINLGKYGIVAGRNLGTDLLVRMPTDRSTYADTLFSFDAWAEGGASTTAPRYELRLTTRSAGALESCYDMGEAQLLTLELVKPEGETQILQHDNALPKSRGCAISYEVRRVTSYRDSLVVNVQYVSVPGFEGPNMFQMVVTGTVAR